MDLFVWILTIVVFFVALLLLLCTLLKTKRLRYIKKRNRFLFMHNSGEDLCEKKQKIINKHCYLQKNQPLIFEVQYETNN